MPVTEPTCNEYQRALLRPATLPLPCQPLHNFQLSDLPPFRQTAITEWAACLYAKSGDIKAKTTSGLVTFFSRQPELDWSWLQRVHSDWVCCPQCGRSFPKDARYWWWRNKPKGYLYLDACRDCKCQTAQRWGERKRKRNSRTPSVIDNLS